MAVLTVAVVAGSATGVLAAPASPPTAAVAVSEALAPVLRGAATAAGTGSESLRFYARTVGASTWDLLDGVSVAGRTAFRALPADRLDIGEAFEYRIDHCDGSGCNPSAVQTGHVSPDVAAGSRPGATRLPFAIGDKISAQVDVGSGNLLVSTTQMSVRRVNGSLDLGVIYNGRTLAPGSRFNSVISPGWRFSTGNDVRLLLTGANRIVFYGPGGLTGTFTSSGTGYVSPKTMKATLTRDTTANEYRLEMHGSGDRYVFGSAGRLLRVVDRNDNVTSVSYGYGILNQVQGAVGEHGARTVNVSSDTGSGRITGLSQSPAGAAARSVEYSYDGDGRLDEIVDVLGRSTTFGYSAAGDLTSITAPGGAETRFTYDSEHRVTEVSQPSAGTDRAVTRIVYDTGSTVVADPNTDQSQPVSAVPNTRYDLKAGERLLLVEKTTDPTGVEQERTYTPFYDVASATNSSGTTTFGYDPNINGGESLTSTTSATGAASSFGYANAAPAQYLPSEGEDAQGNASTYGYDDKGNFGSSSDSSGATARVERNGDGTIDAAFDPKDHKTDYTNDAVKQLTGIAPPAGNSLGNRAYTYDPYGRIQTFTSGRNVVETYSYDAADRVTEIDYSDTTASVSYTYDSAGRVQTRTDGSGITTYTYDPLGRLASRLHSAGGGLQSYGYDLVGNLVTESDATPVTGTGTTTHTYDTRNLIKSTVTPDGRTIRYAHDPDRRRTDVWMGTNTGNTTWAAHTHTDYNEAGQITRVWTARASNDATRVSDLSYDYTSPGSGACVTALQPAGTKTALRWAQTDHIAGTTTSYCYDGGNRLTRASTSGGDTWAYSYDANGNRTETRKNGTVVQTQTVNSANQLTGTGYTYDGAGNLTTAPGGMTLTYNGSNQLTGRSGSANGSYVFAGSNQNELISQVVPGGNTYDYTWGRTDRHGLPLLEKFTNPNGTNTLWHDDAGSPLAIRTFSGGVAYYALDGLGSPVALVNTNGVHIASYSYDPYGEITVTNLTNNAATNLNPYRFTGGLHDRTTGYLKLGQRFYDPATGQWTQQDAVEPLANPTRANRYQYAGSDPINFVDMTGLYPYPEPDPYEFNTICTADYCSEIEGVPLPYNYSCVAGFGLASISVAAFATGPFAVAASIFITAGSMGC